MRASFRFSSKLRLAAVLAAASLAALSAAAQQGRHDSLVIQGLKVRTDVPFAPTGQRVIFQQIVPCRLVDTRPEQGFDAPHGAPRLSSGEARNYAMTRELPAENGCGLANRRLADPCASTASLTAASAWRAKPDRCSAGLRITHEQAAPTRNPAVIARSKKVYA